MVLVLVPGPWSDMDLDMDMDAGVGRDMDIHGMIIDLAIVTVMGIRTDRFMDIDVDMPMFIRSQIAPN